MSGPKTPQFKRLIGVAFAIALAVGCCGGVTRPRPTGAALLTYTDSICVLGVKGKLGIVLKKSIFTINFNPEWREAWWVCEHVRPANLVKKFKRGNDFHPDSDLPESLRVDGSDYKGTRFDRGHLAPAGDWTYSKQALHTTFLYSNMSAQYPDLNRKSWKDAEEAVRSYILDNNCEAFIFTGLLLPASAKTIGRHRVAIPGSYYKVVAYLHPNGKFSGAGYEGHNVKGEEITLFVPIRAVEAASGFNFFPLLDDSVEVRIEQ